MHNHSVEDLIGKIDELAQLMDEFALHQAELSGEDWKVAFRRQRRSQPVEEIEENFNIGIGQLIMPQATAVVEQRPSGLPVSSPMNGIYYASPSPSAPPFVKPGESVTAGQVVGLIEAMKVFNEIVAPVSGIVDKVVAESGQLVQPGDPLLYII